MALAFLVAHLDSSYSMGYALLAHLTASTAPSQRPAQGAIQGSTSILGYVFLSVLPPPMPTPLQ